MSERGLKILIVILGVMLNGGVLLCRWHESERALAIVDSPPMQGVFWNKQRRTLTICAPQGEMSIERAEWFQELLSQAIQEARMGDSM